MLRSRKETNDDISAIPSETSSFRRRESELRSIERRFSNCLLHRGSSIPVASRFREEFEIAIPSSVTQKPSILARFHITMPKKAKLSANNYDGSGADELPTHVPLDVSLSSHSPGGGFTAMDQKSESRQGSPYIPGPDRHPRSGDEPAVPWQRVTREGTAHCSGSMANNEHPYAQPSSISTGPDAVRQHMQQPWATPRDAVPSWPSIERESKYQRARSCTASVSASIVEINSSSHDIEPCGESVAIQLQSMRRQESVVSCGKARLVTIPAVNKPAESVGEILDAATKFRSQPQVILDSSAVCVQQWPVEAENPGGQSQPEEARSNRKDTQRLPCPPLPVHVDPSTSLPDDESKSLPGKLGRAVKSRFNKLMSRRPSSQLEERPVRDAQFHHTAEGSQCHDNYEYPHFGLGATHVVSQQGSLPRTAASV